jgi:SsrA-binding protein
MNDTHLFSKKRNPRASDRGSSLIKTKSLLVSNRDLARNYEIAQIYVCGIVLEGHEVKAIKENKVSIEGAFAKVLNGEVFLLNMDIGRYSKKGKDTETYDSKRPRKLLLNKNEISVLAKELDQKGKTAVPQALVLQNGRIKVELALVKGRKKFDKHAYEKEKQMEADLQKEVKDLKMDMV